MATWRYTDVNSGAPGEEVSRLLRRQQQRLEQQARKAGKAADVQARREGALSGALDAMQGDMKLRRDGTIRGTAHDLAAVETFLQRLDVTIREKADAVLQQYADDPASATAALEKEREKFVRALPQEAQPQADLIFRRQALVVARQARQGFEKRQRQERLATLDEMLARREQDIGRLALSTGLNDPEGEELLEQELQDTDAQLQRAVEQGAITPLRRQQVMRRLRQQALELRIEGAIEQAPDLASKKQVLEQLNAEWQQGKGIAGNLAADEWLNVRTRLETKLRMAEAEASQPARGAMRRVMMAIRSGQPPSELDLGLLQRTVEDSGSEKVAKVLQQAERAKRLLDSVTRLPLPEAMRMAEEAKALAEKEPTEDNVLMASAMQARVAWMQEQQRKDPLSFAGKAGLIENREEKMMPLSASSDAAQWRQRMEVAEAVARSQKTPLRYLTNDERKTLKREWDALDAAGREAFLARLSEGTGNRLARVLQEMGVEKAEIAHLGYLQAWGNREQVRDALEGMDLLKGGVVKVPPSARNILIKELSGVVPIGALEGVKKAADGIYAKLAVEQGAEEFDDDLYRQAIEIALGKNGDGGGFAEWNGRKILLPPSISVEEFEARMTALNDGALAKISQTGGRPVFARKNGSFAPVNAAQLRKLHVVPIAAGMFQFSITDPEDGPPVFIVDEKTGRPWVLNAALLKRLAVGSGPSMKRRPTRPEDEIAAP